MSRVNVPYINRNYKRGQYANHDRIVDNDNEFSGNINIAKHI